MRGKGQNDVSFDHWSSLCEAVLNDHLDHRWVFLLGHTSPMSYVHSVIDLLRHPQLLFPGICPLFCATPTGCPPVQSPFRMTHSLADFSDPHLNSCGFTHISHTSSGCTGFLITALPNLSATAHCSNQHLFKILVGNRPMPPKSRVKEEDQTFKSSNFIFFILNDRTQCRLTDSAAWQALKQGSMFM